MDKKEVARLRRFCKFVLKDDFDKFDFEAEVDNALNFDENRRILEEKIKSLGLKDISNVAKADITELVHREQDELTRLKEKEEKQAQLEFEKSLDLIVSRKNSELLEQKFFLLRQFIGMIANGNANGLIVEGEPGLGKSYNIQKVLGENNIPFIYCAGFTTTLELYNFLSENKDKIIFFDDTKSIFEKKDNLEMLKAALFSPRNGARMVSYMSNSPKLRGPDSFIFTGRIIIAINQLGKEDVDMEAVLDRVLHYHLNFSYKEKMQILAELSNLEYEGLDSEERGKIFAWIRENTCEATKNLNFRLLFKLYECFKFNKDKWEDIAKAILKQDSRISMIIELCKRHNSIREAQRVFTEETGLSRRTFFRYKAKLEV